MFKPKLKIRANVFYQSKFEESPKDTLKILLDLGKPTKRGIKKCYKCGSYNGTRGVMCKNKQCGAIFKGCGEKERSNLDAIKLISGTSRQVFSVRVRGKGPEYRGFVQLPLVEGNKATQETDVALSEVALCFVDSCQRLFDDSILKCHEAQENKTFSICVHIKSALKSVGVAVPVDTNNCLLHSLNFADDVKQKLWLLSTETRGALVQRISKTVMAVKCQVSPKHPLGYLHFTFCMSKGNKVIYDKFFCSCLNYKGIQDCTMNQKCVHFYACIWAFASDMQFTDEFIEFLNTELCLGQSKPSLNCRSIQNNANIYKKPISSKICQVQMKTITVPKKYGKPLQKISVTKIDASVHFVDWLTSVTERINQCLFHNKTECVENLNSYIPTPFFELLQERIHSDESFNSFYVVHESTNLSYVISNLSYLKKIFDTPQISLQLVQFSKKEGDLFIEQEKASFLKVGLEKGAVGAFSPFTIRWSSDVLPASCFGKLELSFCIGCCNDGEFKTNI
ncbi:hypothetical protein RN001_011618 [Aquatica leii]|uniref:SWIM-type domain-containing protein n=1 Tax=Aquatica leii TaxID=1421715 RepID=A0AAN7P5Z8_9COLE|nr:hypothetical protein RN001_011618 [Aquatica leii]